MNENNSSKLPHIRIPNKDGENFIKLVKTSFKNERIINNEYKIIHQGNTIFFPLEKDKNKIQTLKKKIGNKFHYEIKYIEGKLNQNYHPQSLKEILEKKIPKEYHKLIPGSYDIIGNIAILEFSEKSNLPKYDSKKYKSEIAKAVAFLNKNVKTVYEKLSEVKGEYRIRDLKTLYGPPISETIHKENNCLLKVDVKKTFFTPRLFYERKRIISYEYSQEEHIVDLFSGVGPFSIEIAKNHEVKIIAFDVNPSAVKYLKENIKINDLKGIIEPYNINIKKLRKKTNPLSIEFENWAQRIIMNLPEKSLDFLDVACHLLNLSGGILHVYQFVKKPNSSHKALEKLLFSLDNLSWKVKKIIKNKIVKSYSPQEDLVVIDAFIEPKNNKI